ncbi:hypothetical protein PG997_005315 [Apiospora hydei]|uniref:2EXR domain-containing protein n=1 Tax=Apiospora hydei TaxID=1337664 RepID=A0ABR1X4L8_9PEZI
MAAPTFPYFPRLPAELQIMVWKEFAHAEASSRAVVVHTTQEIDEDGERRRATLHFLPLKRLISPLLTVNVQSRAVALRHYKTRINLFELPAPVPSILPFWLDDAEDLQGPRSWSQCRFPSRPIWGPEQDWATHTELLICRRASDLVEYAGTEAEMMAAESNNSSGVYQPRGCVYLDLESDRFLFFDQWAWAPWVQQSYGLRALSVDAFGALKYQRVPLDHADLKRILDRRPPVLRNTSAALSGDVLGRIRNLVFEDFRTSSEDEEEDYMEGVQGLGRGGVWVGGNGTAAAYYDDSYGKASPALRNTLPRAFSADGWLGGFVLNEEMQRCFFDDIEDKGPEHLDIRKAKLVRGPGDEEGEAGWLDWDEEDGDDWYGSEDEDEYDLEEHMIWWV